MMNASLMLDGWQAAVSALLTEPDLENREFILGGPTLGDIRRLAACLRAQLGDEQEQPVCLVTEDKTLIAAALLARLVGCPPLILAYALSNQALRALHQDTGCCLALSDRPRALPGPMELIVPKSNTACAWPIEQTDFDEQAILISLYTGGSTGAPQIWPKTVQNLFGEAFLLARLLAVSSRDRIVATIVPYHIYGLLFAVCLPLLAGASVIRETPSFPEEIIQVATGHQATMLVSVPAHYKALHSKAPLGDYLRLAVSSAGMLDPEDNSTFCRANTAGIVEVYGSTETGGIALRNRSRGEEAMTPYPVLDWLVRDGRLLVRSPFLSPGVALDQEGYFLAGDRITACGTSQILLQGRVDAIVKVGGKRVDLDEIRRLITGMPGVSDCLVLALADTGNREHRVVALVETGSMTAESIRALLLSRLEPYAVPRAIKMVEQLPLKANGKHDREAVLRLLAS